MKRLAMMVWVTTLAGGLFSATVRAQETLPRLVDLGAKQCIPCKKMAPILEELREEYAGRLEVEFIDVWQKENAEKGKEYGIKLIPTQIFFGADGKELWRHEGFLSKEAILAKWEEMGVDLRTKAEHVERWEPAKVDTRKPDQICYLCDGDIPRKSRVVVHTDTGQVNICSPHHFFVMLSCLQSDVEKTEQAVRVTDAAEGRLIPAMSAQYLVGQEAGTGRPTVLAYANDTAARKARGTAGGSILGYTALRTQEFATRCGFCDRAVYPQDASSVKVGPGLQSWGCCAHCALGVAARMGMDIEVKQPDALTGEMITIKTLNGSVASVDPKGAIAWFGQKKRADGIFGSAGCFHQGNFVNRDSLRAWLDQNPLETGNEITIDQALADKMKLSTAQIAKACKIGECAPR